MKSKDYVQELNGLATGQLENTASLKQVRKDIARVKTVLRQQELNK